MLTRLKVCGFKNLVDVEVYFGPFTCIAGPNGIGKSNLFDAIQFLSLLADKPFVEAASDVRGGDEVEALFTKNGNGSMRLECDVLIAPEGKDDFNQLARASYTFLTYKLELRLEKQDPKSGLPRVRLKKEELSYVAKGRAKKLLPFPCEKEWFDSVVRVSARRTPYISTAMHSTQPSPVIRLHADRMQEKKGARRGGGKPTEYSVTDLPRTVLSSAQNADETRTAVLLRHEMRSWRQLQLEPSGLRQADDFRDPQRIDVFGAHVPATLHRLETSSGKRSAVDAEIANRLAELVEGVHSVRVDRDEGRRLLRFMMKDSQGVELPANSLSDGTLRFVALAVMEQDPEATGVLCLEEPENGIHPQRIDAMLQLLTDMAVDTQSPVDKDRPLRQVITTTHSPVVVSHAHPNDILFARKRTHLVDGRPVGGLELLGLDNTWRSSSASVSIGVVMDFLGAQAVAADASAAHKTSENETSEFRASTRVYDLVRHQLLLPGFGGGEG